MTMWYSTFKRRLSFVGFVAIIVGAFWSEMVRTYMEGGWGGLILPIFWWGIIIGLWLSQREH